MTLNWIKRIRDDSTNLNKSFGKVYYSKLKAKITNGIKEKTKMQWRLPCLYAEPHPRSQHAAKFSKHKSCESGDIDFWNCQVIGDIMYLICNVNLQDHLNEGSCESLDGIS